MTETSNEAGAGPGGLGDFADEMVVFHGVEGQNLYIDSANPRNYHEAMNEVADAEPVTIVGKLFLPSEELGQPVVIVVPGSLGVGPNHRAHSETLVGAGYGVLLLDPFGARAVESTVANQTPYSFAASAYDVLAALGVLIEHPLVDPSRVSAQGHSRGGSAVMAAANRRYADAVIGPDVALAGAYGVYPWCGHQFADANVGRTTVRAILAERDEWCSLQQAQANIYAIAATGGEASVRIVADAAHSFDRLEPVHELADAMVAPRAPTVYLADDGAMIDPHSGEPDPALTDLDMFIAAAKGGFSVQGASIGGVGDQPDVFRADMLAFHGAALGSP